MHVHICKCVCVCVYNTLTHTCIYVCKFATLNKMRHLEVERIKEYILVKQSNNICFLYNFEYMYKVFNAIFKTRSFCIQLFIVNIKQEYFQQVTDRHI